MNRTQWSVVIAVALATALLWTHYVVFPVAPLSPDEGLHIVLSRALADGEGYPHDATAPLWGGTPTPPLVPLLLAALWRIAPDFPANLPALKAVSGVPVLGLILLLPVYLCRVGVAPWAAVAATALTAASPLVMRQATVIVSALPFSFLLLALLLAAERAQAHSRSFGAGVLAGCCAGLLCLTRWAGLPVAIAVGVRVARRSPRAAGAGFCYGLIFTVLPWVAWLITYGRIDAPGAWSLGSFRTAAADAALRAIELPALTAVSCLPGFSDLTAGGSTLGAQLLLYGLGAVTIASLYSQAFGAPIATLLLASILAPSMGFPMAATPWLLAALLSAALPPSNARWQASVPALVVGSLMLAAGVGHQRYWQQGLSYRQASLPPVSVAASEALP